MRVLRPAYDSTTCPHSAVKKPGIQHGDQLFPTMLPECGHVTLTVLFDSLHLSFLICRLKCLID